MQYGERFNSLTHLFGTILALIGAVALIRLAAQAGDPWKLASFSVFSISMVLLYGASTLYHGSWGAIKQRLAKLDHCAIFVLIAGSYTPFTLVTLRGAWGWSLFGAIWGLALLGIARELWWTRRPSPSVALYVLMGWAGLCALGPLHARLSSAGLLWLGLGAGLYTIGIVFYRLGKRWRHSHGVWHLFVLGGTASHFYTVLNFV
ncbi:hemolysin III family protein [Chitinimonas sp.]|uniref:PAQR family membrane homeostasis protein TrhA n=1 Tax=Chitinimonas sp. TaxID=1934313 RepID=UPI0035B0A3F6